MYPLVLSAPLLVFVWNDEILTSLKSLSAMKAVALKLPIESVKCSLPSTIESSSMGSFAINSFVPIGTHIVPSSF